MSDNKYTLKKKIQYELDDFISKGFWAQLALLVGCVVCLVFVFAIILMIFAGGEDFSESLWTSLMHIIDQGTITGDETENSTYLFFMLGITFLGMAFTSAIIGIISAAVQNKMNELNKGHSRIIERDHVVVLGFNENTHTIRNEIEDNNNKRKGNKTLVIADDLPKEEMENISRQVSWNRRNPKEDDETAKKKEKKTTTLFRSGNLISENTLIMCATDRARAVIVNGNDDFETIRILLALAAYLKKMNAYIGDDHMPSVVALIHKRENLTAAKIAAGVLHESGSRDKKMKNEYMVRIMYFEKILARLFAQVCVQPGLSLVMSDLLNYNNASFYIEDKNSDNDEKLQSAIMGKNIAEITDIIHGVTPVGFANVDENLQAHILLNPGQEIKYSKGDMLVYLSEESMNMSFEAETEVTAVGEPAKHQEAEDKETKNFLVMGWGISVPSVLRNMNEYCEDGSSIDIITPNDIEYGDEELDAFDTQNVIPDDPYNWEHTRRHLDEHPYWFDKNDERHLTNMVILSKCGVEDAEADEKVMVLLLNMREYIKKHCDFKVYITTEIKQSHNQALVQGMSVNDFVVSAQIASRFMVQVAEDTKKFYIFEEILKQRGKTIELRPFSEYIDIEKPFNYQGIVNEVFRKAERTGNREIPIGWIMLDRERSAFDEETDFSRQMRLNPVGEDRGSIFKDEENNGYDGYKLILVTDKAQDMVVTEGMMI